MFNSTRSVNIKLNDVPIECYYSPFKKDKSLPYNYFKTLILDDDVFTHQDYAVINGALDIEICRILCIYTTPESKVQTVVRKYILARNLSDKLREVGCTKFDDNEVVEDLMQDYTITPKRFLRRCHIIIGHESEDCIVTRSKLNPLSYFSCRFALTTNGICAKLSLPQVLTKLNSDTLVKTKEMNTRSKRNTNRRGTENVPMIPMDDSSSEENTPEKVKNLGTLLKNTKLSTQTICSPAQRNSVRRNLNKSFGESPEKNRKSILNYSIITDEELDNSLIVKLKVSDKNRVPLVVVKKDNTDGYSSILKSKESEASQPVRKSSRASVRKSYADYISPIKTTPRKRGVLQNINKNGDTYTEENTPVKVARGRSDWSNADGCSETPPKSSSKRRDIPSGQKALRTPTHYRDREMPPPEVNNVRSSARRCLRLTSNVEEGAVVGGTKSSKRRLSMNINKDDEKISVTEKKIDLNESIRTTMLKVRLKKAEIFESISGSSKFFYDTSSDENEENVSEKSKGRSRSTESDSSWSPGTPPKARRLTETSVNPGHPPGESVPNTPRTKQQAASFTAKEPPSRTRSRSLRSDKEEASDTQRPSRVHSPAKDSDDDRSSPCETPSKTPKARRRTNRRESQAVCKTPKAPRTPRSSAKQTLKTPGSRARLIREGVITPSMHSRIKAVAGDSTPLKMARTQLHVSFVPSALPCREKEYCEVFSFLEGKLLDGCGGCMYISGVPGTGKTATVTAAINNLLGKKNIPKFSYVSINGMKLTEPRQAYVEILKQLDNKVVPWEQAQSILEERFTKRKKNMPVVMLIDELDILCTKRQDVVYNLLDWPAKAKSQLMVVTIANTMDLPERLLMSRVTSRLGLTRLTFQAYTYKQLQEIVTKRLSGTDSFNPDAVQFVARKVASVSGDARRALDICRRAAEIAEAEGKGQLVGMGHVIEALDAMITQPKVRAIKNCSRLEQLLMQSIVAEVERTGVEETTFADVFKMLSICAAIDGFRMVSTTTALTSVARLSASRLILTDQKCSDITQRIVLNVSVDDVYYALKKD